MNAIVSGQARTALLIDGDTLFSFDIDTPEIPKPRRESDFRFLFGEATDLRFIQNTRKEDVLKELRADYDKTCALDLALMLLDEDISKTKPLIGEALEDLLTEENIIVYLESIFYAKPLPAGADTENALSVCKNAFSKTHDWLSALVAKQDDIAWVSEVWDNIAIDIFGDEEKRADFQKVIIHEGIFRELVLHCHDNSKINLINFSAGTNKLITSLPNHRAVLQALFIPFRQPRVSPEEKRLLKDEEEETVSTRQKGRQRIDGESVKNKVLATISRIMTALTARNLASAQKLTDELIPFQLRNGKPIHAVKSLCQIAQNAKELGFYEFQLELTERAIGLEYSDAWTQAQYGDALLQNNKFDEALKTYEIAISFSIGQGTGIEIVARNGYAEVLKAQGKLDEALQIYQEVMKSHPEDSFSKNGYAEILKAQGRLDEASKIYRETMNSHPEDVVAKTGYAEILKAQGKLDEASKIYRETMNSHPEDVVARNGLCGVLFALGRYNEASKIYRETMNSHPEDVVAKIGYAGVLKEQGKLEEALQVYEEIKNALPTNIIAKTGYAEVLKEQGKLEEALQAYREMIESHPEDVVAKTGYAGVLKAQGKLDEALQIYQETIKSHPEDVVAKKNHDKILKRIANLNKSLKIQEESIKSYPEDMISKEEYEEVLKANADLNKSLENYEKLTGNLLKMLLQIQFMRVPSRNWQK